MKTEITINNVIYKIGDILTREDFSDRKIAYIGTNAVFVEIIDEKKFVVNKCDIIEFCRLFNFTVKKPTKLIRHEFWVNIYAEFTSGRYATRGEADNCAFGGRIDCVKYIYEKEIEV